MFEAVPWIRAATDLLPRAWAYVQEQRDPVRAQAARVLRAFEAHGLARTQIVRLLPPELTLPMTAFASAQALREHLSPGLLDWIADYLLLDRAWLDCAPNVGPHSPDKHCFYKQPDALRDWLAQRVEARPFAFTLYVLKADPAAIERPQAGPFAMVLAEQHAELGDQSLRRYQRLSDGAHFEHLPCVADLVATCTIADALSIPLRGLEIRPKQLQRLEAGTVLVAEVLKRPFGIWHPHELVTAPVSANPWLVTARQEAQKWLTEADLRGALQDHNKTKEIA